MLCVPSWSLSFRAIRTGEMKLLRSSALFSQEHWGQNNWMIHDCDFKLDKHNWTLHFYAYTLVQHPHDLKKLWFVLGMTDRYYCRQHICTYANKLLKIFDMSYQIAALFFLYGYRRCRIIFNLWLSAHASLQLNLIELITQHVLPTSPESTVSLTQ